MTTLLLLGASGFLGSHLHEAINNASDAPSVVAVSRGRPRQVLGPDSSWVPLDLGLASVDDLVVLIQASRPDVIVNCAGSTSGTPEQLWAINTTFVENLIQALRVAGPAPLIHLGSAAEYGIQPDGIAISEDAPAEPVSTYGRAKLAATRKIVHASEAGDISATVLRVFNPVGPRQPVDSLAARAMSELTQARRYGRQTISLGRLDAYRDFVAARDVASAILRCTRLVDQDPVLNVGSGEPTLCRDFVRLLADVGGIDCEITETGTVSDRSLDVLWQQADLTRLTRTLNWRPTIDLATTAHELWELTSA